MKRKDAASLLTIGSFLLVVELFYLQLRILAFYLQLELLCLQLKLFYCWSFLAYGRKVRLIRALRDCKQRSLTVSKQAPTVSKKASPVVLPRLPGEIFPLEAFVKFQSVLVNPIQF